MVLAYSLSSNKFPLTTFNWVGLDGTQILTHMTPTVNYNSSCEFSDIVKAHTGHHNLAQTPNALLLFGNGDGGGGPTPDHIERLRRWRALSHENDPKGAQSAVVRMGGSLDEFFEEVLKDTDDGKTLPSWWGELYLEIHRGTYTSQGEPLQFNGCLVLTKFSSNKERQPGRRDCYAECRDVVHVGVVGPRLRLRLSSRGGSVQPQVLANQYRRYDCAGRPCACATSTIHSPAPSSTVWPMTWPTSTPSFASSPRLS